MVLTLTEEQEKKLLEYFKQFDDLEKDPKVREEVLMRARKRSHLTYKDLETVFR